MSDLMLRTVGPGGEAYGGFCWPLEVGAVVEAPDWDPEPRCGAGLHGALRGEGDGSLLSWAADAVWLVCEVDEWVDLGDKIKAPRCTIIHVGDRASATAVVQARCPGSAVIGGTATAGDCGRATAGYRGRATAGDGGTATAGDGGTATAGYYGTLVLSRWDATAQRRRVHVAYVGEDGIEPGVAYRLDPDGRFARADGGVQ